MDVDFTKLDQYDHDRVLGYYDTYIRKHLKSDTILLATGTDCDTMIDLYLKYPDSIKGFGEIKCYDHNTDKNGNTIRLPYGNLQWIRPLCDFNSKVGLPIFIHWSVYNKDRKDELDRLLSEYPSIPFVLCHCGMSRHYDIHSQYTRVMDLMLKHGNLYVDVSFDAAEFLLQHLDYLKTLDGRCFLGTDLNPKCMRHDGWDKPLSTFKQLYEIRLRYNHTIKKLFGL